MIGQRTTRAVIYIFTQEGFSADAYLHDFYDAEYRSVASAAFERLQNLLNLYYLKKLCCVGGSVKQKLGFIKRVHKG